MTLLNEHIDQPDVTGSTADAASAPKTSQFSRRGFLKRLSHMGAALGLGVAGVAATAKPAHACEPESYYDYKYEYTRCGLCRINGAVGNYRTRYRRSCRNCAGGPVCSAWEQVGRICIAC